MGIAPHDPIKVLWDCLSSNSSFILCLVCPSPTCWHHLAWSYQGLVRQFFCPVCLACPGLTRNHRFTCTWSFRYVISVCLSDFCVSLQVSRWACLLNQKLISFSIAFLRSYPGQGLSYNMLQNARPHMWHVTVAVSHVVTTKLPWLQQLHITQLSHTNAGKQET